MRKFDSLTSVAAPYPFENVNTDQIIRIERCARTPRNEMGVWAFEMERYKPDGSDSENFVLNRTPFRDASILVAGDNFGCGSSREHAVWAILGMGVRCIIAPSFGEIFAGNCFNNGLLPIRLNADQVVIFMKYLASASAEHPERATLTVDLEKQKIITPWGDIVTFKVEPLQREALLEGLDPIGVTLKRRSSIESFQIRQRELRPWIWHVP
jgi:3-isopropylmalate/(R)-2-methylmalate dehydratase small subunit